MFHNSKQCFWAYQQGWRTKRLNVPNFTELLTGDFTAEVFLDTKVILEYVLRGEELS